MRKTFVGWENAMTAYGLRYSRQIGSYHLSVYQSGAAWRWCVTLTNGILDGLAPSVDVGIVSCSDALKSHLERSH